MKTIILSVLFALLTNFSFAGIEKIVPSVKKGEKGWDFYTDDEGMEVASTTKSYDLIDKRYFKGAWHKFANCKDINIEVIIEEKETGDVCGVVKNNVIASSDYAIEEKGKDFHIQTFKLANCRVIRSMHENPETVKLIIGVQD